MKYFLYCRKSTEESAGKQLNSLQAQEDAMMELAQRDNLEVVKIYRESQSAKTVGRPVLAQMLKDMRRGKADGILCWKLDRLARNWEESGQIQQMVSDGLIKKIKCYDKEYDMETNNIIIGVEVGQAIQYSVELSVNVNRGMLFKFKNGVWPTMAPIGYVNKQRNAHDRYIVVDKQTSPLVQYMFQQYATGTYSLKDISEHIYQKGLMTKGRNKYPAQRVKDILTNPFYHGLMRWRELEQVGTHEPIISKELFDQCQEVMTGRNRPRPQKHMFPYRGLFCCQSCGSALTTDYKKNQYRYYRCTGGKDPHCPQKKINIREEVFDEYIAQQFSQINFDEELIEIMYEASLEDLKRDTEQNTSICDGLEKELESLKLKRSELLQMRINKELTPEEYADEKAKCKQEMQNVQKQIRNSQNTSDPLATIELTKKVFLDSNSLKKRFISAQDEEKRNVVSEVLSNSKKSTVHGRETVILQYKSPFDIIAGASVSFDNERMWT